MQPAWLLPLRKAGIAALPNSVSRRCRTKTGVSPTSRRSPGCRSNRLAEPANDTAAKTALGKYLFARLPGVRLVFVNGQYSTALSSVHGLPDGVRVSNLAAALVADSEFLKRQFGLCALTDDNAFAALNQAFFPDGGFVQVPAGVSVAEPIQFIFISTAKQGGETIQPRNLIIAGANSRATVIESYLSADNAAYFTNAVTEIAAGTTPCWST